MYFPKYWETQKIHFRLDTPEISGILGWDLHKAEFTSIKKRLHPLALLTVSRHYRTVDEFSFLLVASSSVIRIESFYHNGTLQLTQSNVIR